ncbi:hypothetical protein GCM10009696_17750 [Kocuria himachalensis]
MRGPLRGLHRGGQDLPEIAPEGIHHTRTLETWFEGWKVHQLEAAIDVQR